MQLTDGAGVAVGAGDGAGVADGAEVEGGGVGIDRGLQPSLDLWVLVRVP